MLPSEKVMFEETCNALQHAWIVGVWSTCVSPDMINLCLSNLWIASLSSKKKMLMVSANGLPSMLLVLRIPLLS